MTSASVPWLRTELSTSGPAVHGALDHAELACLGIAPNEIIDFSENSNPFGPSPSVQAAIQTANPATYPDRECLGLRHLLAEQLNCDLQNIVVGNGAAELIWLIGFAFLRSGDRVMIVGPTFGEYERTARLMGAQVMTWWANWCDDFVVETAGISAALQKEQPQLCFLCNPNNPTGVVTPASAIEAWALAHPQTLFVIDEAYIDFVPEMDSIYSCGLPNIFVIRSMTKAYALAGLRLGYALGPPELIAGLKQVRIPWSVNTVAQAAGVAALTDQVYLQQSLQQLTAATAEFRAQLTAIGMIPLTSSTHYMLVPIKPPDENAHSLRAKLLPHGLLVRDCASFGLPNHIRLATRRPEENQQLIACLVHNRIS